MSDIKDEIDWEFPGAATTEAQSNIFWQGVVRQSSYFTTDYLASKVIISPRLQWRRD